MSWSTSAPSGVSWSGGTTSSSTKNNYYEFYIKSWIARGKDATVYLKVELCASNYAREYWSIAPNAEMFAVVGSDQSATYGAKPANAGGSVTVKTIYWTGTAAPNATVSVRGSNTSKYTGYNKHSAPAYTSSYKITYNGNGATSGSTADSVHVYGSSVSVHACGFRRTGWHFTGWNSKADGTGTSYAVGSAWYGNSNITLYAQWAKDTYPITYYGNSPDGTTVTDVPDAGTKEYGDTNYHLSSQEPVCSGYEFMYWNTEPDGSGTYYGAGQPYSDNEPLNLYAAWRGVYPVTYDGNGATGGSTASQEKRYDRPLTLQTNRFTRDKHTFLYWNTAADGTGTRYDEGEEYLGSYPLALYAIWQKNNIPVFFKDGSGNVHQVEKAYYKDGNGEVHGCVVYYKDSSGIVHEIS